MIDTRVRHSGRVKLHADFPISSQPLRKTRYFSHVTLTVQSTDKRLNGFDLSPTSHSSRTYRQFDEMKVQLCAMLGCWRRGRKEEIVQVEITSTDKKLDISS